MISIEEYLRSQGAALVDDPFGGRSWVWQGRKFQAGFAEEFVAEGAVELGAEAEIRANLARWQAADLGVCVACYADIGDANRLSPSGRCAACERTCDAVAAEEAE